MEHDRKAIRIVVARIARKLGIPVIAICGACDDSVSPALLRRLGFEACFACVSRTLSDRELRRGAAARLTATSAQVGQMIASSLRPITNAGAPGSRRAAAPA